MANLTKNQSNKSAGPPSLCYYQQWGGGFNTDCCWELKASRLIITGAKGGEAACKAALKLDKKLLN